MTVLSNSQIVARLNDSVIIEPFNPLNVNTSSYDVTLGPHYFIEQKPSFWHRQSTYNIWDLNCVYQVWGVPRYAQPAREVMRISRFSNQQWWKGVGGDDMIILIPPKHTILAHTVEFIGGRHNVTTMMKARSSFGRNFIEVCKCAGYGDVGYTNRWTMEITNNSRFYHIPLVVGRRIAQIVFLQTGELAGGGDYADTGKYQAGSDLKILQKTWHPEMMLPRLDRDRDIWRN